MIDYLELIKLNEFPVQQEVVAGESWFVITGPDGVGRRISESKLKEYMEGKTDFSMDDFYEGYINAQRKPYLFQKTGQVVTDSGSFTLSPELPLTQVIFTGLVDELRGITGTAEYFEAVNHTGRNFPIRDKYATPGAFDFGGSDYTFVNGSKIAFKKEGTYWVPTPVMTAEEKTRFVVRPAFDLDNIRVMTSTAPDDKLIKSNVLGINGETLNFKETDKWVDGSEMDDSKVDGFIYVKSGGKYLVESSFLSTGVINVSRFGVIPDFKSISDYTDYHALISSIFTIAGNMGSGSIITGSSIKVIFPSSKHGLGYGVSGDITANGTFDIEMNAPLVRVGSYNTANKYFFLVGRSAVETVPFLNRKYHNRRFKLWARFDGGPQWDGTGNYAGIEVRSVVRSQIEIVESTNFEVGVRFTGYNSGFAYNKMTLGNLWNNRIHVDCYSYSVLGNSAGFITSCSFDCYGRIGNDYLTGTIPYDRIGIRVNGEGYTPESLTFFNGCIEGLINNDTPIQYKGIPVQVIKGNLNKFLDFRHEANFRSGEKPTFLKVEEGYSNFSDLTIVVSSGTTFATDVEDYLLLEDNSQQKQGNKVVSRRGKSRGFSAIANHIVFDSGYFSENWTKYSSTRSHIKNFGSINTNGDTFRYIPRNATLGLDNDIDSEGFLKLAVGTGIFIDIDTSEMKRFSRIIDHDPEKPAKCGYYLFDENGEKIPWLEGSVRNLNGVLQSTEWTAYGSGGATDYGGTESELKAYGKKADISVTDKVKKVRIILYGIGSVETGRYSRVKSLRIVNIDGFGISKNISPFADGRRYATLPPSIGSYTDGDVVYYDHSIGTDNIDFWIAKSNGIDDVAIWKEFFINRNYIPSGSATPTLNIGHRRGYLELTATSGSGNTTVPPDVFEEGDEVIGEVSGSAKTFVAGSGVTLRFPEGQGLVAPTGSRFIIKFKSPNDALVTIIKPQTAAASANTATVASGATPTKAEFDALLTELRDLKTKMRTAGLLAT